MTLRTQDTLATDIQTLIDTLESLKDLTSEPLDKYDYEQALDWLDEIEYGLNTIRKGIDSKQS